jgi:3-deoxy-D-manno-octulosonic-acid transferase
MKYVMDCAYLLAALAYSPVLIYKMIKHDRYKGGWAQRFGCVIRKTPAKKCIWIHAVSVGEVNATQTIIDQLLQKFPDLDIVLSTTTDTGFARATALFDDKHTVIYFPLDFSCTMARAFRNIKPTLCLLMELEVWPNFVNIAKQSSVPVVVANGRISDRSYTRYKLVKPIIEKIFNNITLILAQTKEYADRFAKIGCPAEKVVVTGSLKYDTAQICDKVEGAAELEKQLHLENKKLIVAGATGTDEEPIILEAYRNLLHHDKYHDIRLVIVPRKPERFKEVAQMIKQRGFACIRYSEVKKSDVPPTSDNQTIILGDTMGDLRKFYSLAHLIFVGRTLVPMGGSDMMEAAALGKCTMFGPGAFNFKQTVDALLQGNGAILVKDSHQLLDSIIKCLNEPAYADEIARNGREVIKQNQGATTRSIEQIEKFLKIDETPEEY